MKRQPNFLPEMDFTTVSNRFPADRHLKAKLDRRTESQTLRHLTVRKGLVDFCSNDYLGLAASDSLADRIRSYHKDHGPFPAGSTGSRLLSGNTVFCENLENSIASFHKSEAGLIFNSGYDANLGLFSCIGKEGDSIIYDELIHASVHDGMKLGKASGYKFLHNDTDHLEERLKQAGGNVFVAVESVYSMDGDRSPLEDIAGLCKKYEANLVVDEAHSTGIYGKSGAGLTVHLGLEKKVFARVHTFGKALGSHGAIVLGSRLLREYLVNFSRPLIYTTALDMDSLVKIGCTYEEMKTSDEQRKTLQALIGFFRERIKKAAKAEMIDSNSPIQCILVPGNERSKEISAGLQDQGFDVRPILNPTVPKGKERLRICLHSFNTEEEVTALVNAIGALL